MISLPTVTIYAASVKPFPSSDVLNERQRPTARLRKARRIQRQNKMLQPGQYCIRIAGSSFKRLSGLGSAIFMNYSIVMA